jgi:hypothetical protein
MTRNRVGFLLVILFVVEIQSFQLLPSLSLNSHFSHASLKYKIRRKNSCLLQMNLETESMPETVSKSKSKTEPDILDFAISTIFTSPYYLGSDELHVPVPTLDTGNIPLWMPNSVKSLGVIALNMTAFAAKYNLIRTANPGDRFTMKYGVLRGKLAPRNANSSCVPCAAAAAAAQAGPTDLTNINAEERGRRIRAGYVLTAMAATASSLADAAGAPPPTRLAAALPLALGWAFFESGRTGL